MNEDRITYYKSMIKLNERDIAKLEDEIHGRQICDTMKQRKLIHSLEVCINNLEGLINKLK